MRRTAFTRAEAQANVGRRVRTRVAFAEVPEAALGTMIRLDRVIDGDDGEVAWVWPGRRTPWIEWFTKAEYEAHLIDVRAPRGGRAPSARAEAVARPARMASRSAGVSRNVSPRPGARALQSPGANDPPTLTPAAD
jgi:hypothetical protein